MAIYFRCLCKQDNPVKLKKCKGCGGTQKAKFFVKVKDLVSLFAFTCFKVT